jgi:hypothetical protein
MDVQRAWGVLYSPQKTLLVFQNVGSSLADLGKRREISSQFHIGQAAVGIWSSKATIRSIHPLRTLCLKWLEIGG